MRKSLAIISAIVILMSLASCRISRDNNSTINSDYIKGVEQGQYDTFISLWESTSDVKILVPNQTWTTEHFSITLSNSTRPGATSNGYEDSPCMVLDLGTKSLSIGECIDSQEFLLFAYANGEPRRKLFTGNDFFWTAALEWSTDDLNQFASGYSCSASVELYDNEETVMLLISTGSRIYKAVYYVNGLA